MWRSSWTLVLVLLGFCRCSLILDPVLIDEASGLADQEFTYEDQDISEHEEEFEEFEELEEPEDEASYVIDNKLSLKKRPLTNIEPGVNYPIGKELAIGDYFEFTGRYNFGTQAMKFQIRSKGAKLVLGVFINPLKATIEFKTKKGKTRKFVNREEKIPLVGEFQLIVEIRTKAFKIFLNGHQIGQYDLPVHDSTTIDKAKTVRMVFDPDYVNPRQLNYSKNSEEYNEVQEFETELAALEHKIKETIHGMDVPELKEYLDSDEGSIEIFQWVLYKMVASTEDHISKSQPGAQWLISNRGPLEMLLTSGKIKNALGSLNVFDHLFRIDPAIVTNPLHLRWAMATSLVHSNPIRSRAISRNNIDWLARYWYFLELNEEGVLMRQFNEGTAWHLTYVTSSYYTDESLTWGRENTLQKKIDEGKIGDMKGYTDGGIKYNNTNKDGVRVGNARQYYYYQVKNLEVLQEIGGVCGATGKFNSAMAQAFGVPATTIGQPGHCAYTYWTGESWELRNSVGGGWTSTRHDHFNPGYLFHMMEESQSHRLPDYILSEKMRYATLLARPEDHLKILESATATCPFNHEAWFQLLAVSSDVVKVSTLQPSVQDSFKEVLLRDRPDGLGEHRLSKYMTVLQNPKTKNRAGSQSYRLYHGIIKGLKSHLNGTMTVEVELRRPSIISQVGMAWGVENAADYSYKMYAKNPHSDYQLMRTSDDEKDYVYVPENKEDQKKYSKYDDDPTVMTGHRKVIKESVMKALEGWELPTQTILIETKCNQEDIANCTLNLLEMWVEGTELTSLDYDVVEGKNIPEVHYDDEDETHGWFEVEIGNMAVLRELNLQWLEGTEPSSVRVIMRGCSQEDTVISENSAQIVTVGGVIGTTLRVETTGNRPVLQNIQAMGVDYDIGQLLKIKGWVDVVSRSTERFLNTERFIISIVESVQFKNRFAKKIEKYGKLEEF